MNERRPDPDALLAHIAAEEGEAGRGRLKVFFGAVAGVGKTYAMLEAGRALKAEGRDVVAGLIETHGRRETDKLLEGLEILPRRAVDYRGVALGEFDLDGALRRKPELILVDELAHTNAAGSLHEKRWQDIEELRDAGIDVFTTVNVQHIESLNDVVARITHIRVRETVPDAVLESADEVELIDLPPAELLKRLDEGRVYIPEQVLRARDNFFRRGNLIALRQLALRYTAEHVDAAMRVYRRAHAVEETWPVAERLLVGVGPSPGSRRLVRAAKRMADRLGAGWMAVFVETPEYASFPEVDRQRVWETLRLARDLGAETASIAGAGTAALIEHARRHNVTKIIVGKPGTSRWQDRLGGSRMDEIVRASGDIDVYVISGDEDEAPIARKPVVEHSRAAGYLKAAGVVVALTAVSILLRAQLELANLIMLYLLGVVFVAARLGRGPAVVASVLGVAAFDWFCVPPYGTFEVADTEYFVVFFVMLTVALVISTLTTRLRRQAELSRRREERTASLFAITRELVGLDEPADIAEVVARHLSATFSVPARLLAPDPFGELRDRGGGGGDPIDAGVARWAFEHGRAAGPGTGTLPRARALYVPVRAGDAPSIAVLELPAENAAVFLDPERMQLVETFAQHAAVALERARLAVEGRRAEHLAELNRLKTEFIAIAAHELRTPLTSLGLSVELLAEGLRHGPDRGEPRPRDDRSASPAERAAMANVAPEPERGGPDPSLELATVAVEDVSRLRTLVDELLDLSRMEDRQVRLELQAAEPRALVRAALRSATAGEELTRPPIQTELAEDLAPVRADPDQIERALRNLIENARRHAGPNGRVVVGADELADFVQFSVADNGPGLAIADQNRIFEPFVGVSAEGHAGLGLAIVRAIVRAHGGDIWVDSGPGPGAVFSFTLPRADRAAPANGP